MSLNAALEGLARELFNGSDKDKNGYIDANELGALLAQINTECDGKQTPAQLKKFTEDTMKELDTNHDNKLSFEEFLAYAKKALE